MVILDQESDMKSLMKINELKITGGFAEPWGDSYLGGLPSGIINLDETEIKKKDFSRNHPKFGKRNYSVMDEITGKG